MRRQLLDTNAALNALAAPERLTAAVRDAVINGPNIVSVVSYWEVLLKSMKGTLNVGDPRSWWVEVLNQLGATVLPLRPEHIAGVYTLPPIHKDPFDRMLISQAITEDLDLVTNDRDVLKYASDRLCVLS